MADKVIPVRVAVRCRPLIPKEQLEGCQECVYIPKREPQVIVGKNRAFTYDFAYGPTTSQKFVYDEAVSSLLEGIFKGYNATILAYGQTGSGKTHTMGSCYTSDQELDEDDLGVIPRVLRQLFHEIEQRPDSEFTVTVSFLEIYNEDVKDLLCPMARREPLSVREDPNEGIKIPGLQEVVVSTPKDAFSCLQRGSEDRSTGATAMNTASSRSHAIFTLSISQKKKDDENDYWKAKFHLVDLAGSERAKKTQAEGDRLKEGININKGLLALGNVISSLGEETSKRMHIPYRDSKLTRLLQDSLGGNSHTLMIACISPADSNMDETVTTLRYADRARKIKNKPIVNRDPQAAEIMRLREELQQLQLQLLGGAGAPTGGSVSNDGNSNILLERIKKLEEENRKLTDELRNAMDQVTELCEARVKAELVRDTQNEKLKDLKDQLKIMMHHECPKYDQKQSVIQGDDGREKEDEPSIDNFHLSLGNLTSKIEELENFQIDSYPVDEDVNTSQNDSQCTAEDDAISQRYALSQARLGRELQELNKILAKKEGLALQMTQNDSQLESMKSRFEFTQQKLEEEVEQLQKDKTKLQGELAKAKTSEKGSDASRKRLKELETKIAELQKKIREQQSTARMKQISDELVSKLNNEIQTVKGQRVKLIKQMKEDTDNFRKWKMSKEKEVIQLKAQDRKRQSEMVRMERLHSRQQAVLRRKAEEASGANKRLKEALLRQRSTAEERKKQQSLSEAGGIGARVRKWLEEDVEFEFSVAEARRHLDSLMQDRKVMTEHLKELEDRAKENQPPEKKAKWMHEVNVDENLTALIKTTKQDMQLRNAQISELQQKLMDAVPEDKGKNKFQQIHTMVEAKCALKYLMSNLISAKLDSAKTKSSLTEIEQQDREAADELKTLKEKVKVEREGFKAKLQEEIHKVEEKHAEYVNHLLSLKNAKSEETVFKSPPNTSQVKKEKLEKSEDTKIRRRTRFGSSFQVQPVVEEEPDVEEDEEIDDKENVFIDEDDDDPEWQAGKTPCAGETRRRRTFVRSNDRPISPMVTCKCVKDCSTRKCPCKKGGNFCEMCHCIDSKCKNREPQIPDSSTTEGLNATFTCDPMSPVRDQPSIEVPPESPAPNIDASVLDAAGKRKRKLLQDSSFFGTAL